MPEKSKTNPFYVKCIGDSVDVSLGRWKDFVLGISIEREGKDGEHVVVDVCSFKPFEIECKHLLPDQDGMLNARFRITLTGENHPWGITEDDFKE